MVKILKAPSDLSKPFKGLYQLSDNEYFSEEVEGWAHSQSTWKKINKKSIKAIIEDSIKPLTKDKRIGIASHYLFLEGEKVFKENTFLRQDLLPMIKKSDYVELKSASVELEKELSVEDKEIFIARELNGLEDPGKFETQKDFIANGGTKEDWRVQKTEHDRKVDHFKSEVLRVKGLYDLEKQRAKDIQERNKQKLKAIEDEWSDKRDQLENEKREYKENLEKAESDGLIILNQDELDIVSMINQACESNPKIKAIRDESTPEVTAIAFHEKSGLWLKAKIDLLNISKCEFTDFKTSDEIDPEDFYWSYKKWEYDIQLASYWWILGKLGVKINKIRMIVASKKVEEAVSYTIPLDDILLKWNEAESRLIKYAREVEDFKNGKSRYDSELILSDPRSMNLDEVFKTETTHTTQAQSV